MSGAIVLPLPRLITVKESLMSTSLKHPRAADPLMRPCATPDQLHRWVRAFVGLDVPRVAVCPGHDAPFDYLLHAYFEPTKDVVVWAPRGGGKTRLAAVATLLDLLHKPGCAARILGGSLEQSLRMWEHLLPDVERLVPHLLVGRSRGSNRRVALSNGSSCAVLTQSQRAVRGLRVQKLRCDEVELFKPDVWDAAQLVTRSRPSAPRGGTPAPISGAIDAISTFHSPFGLMDRIVDRAAASGTRTIRWCLLDVLERCPAARDCGACMLWGECGGVAKRACAGFVTVDDALTMKARVGLDTWEAEMLCKRPSVKHCVFPRFDPARHVLHGECDAGSGPMSLAIDFGFAAPFVCLWVLARPDGATVVLDEYVQDQRTTEEHLEHIESRRWGRLKRVCCDPAGNGRNDQTATSNVQLLRSRGYAVKTRHSRIQDGLELIRTALAPATGTPRLFVHARCVRLIRALQSYHYGAHGGELPAKDGTHDHPIDALRYYFVNTTPREATARSY
jgi:hypothetical protein